jgi:hypothetical protein
MSRGWVVALLLLFAGLCPAERLAPVDESATDPSFLAFRVKLLAAIQRRDVKAVQAWAEESVRPSITLAALGEIGAAVRLGVVRDEKDFIAPYVFVRFPKELDAYTHAAAIRPAVKVRTRPAAGAPVVETLDFDIVRLQGAPKAGWAEIQTPSGKSGWVPRGDVRTQLESRVFFEKKGGVWRITGLISGD